MKSLDRFVRGGKAGSSRIDEIGLGMLFMALISGAFPAMGHAASPASDGAEVARVRGHMQSSPRAAPGQRGVTEIGEDYSSFFVLMQLSRAEFGPCKTTRGVRDMRSTCHPLRRHPPRRRRI